jgi:hypothetical protein
VKLRWFMRIRTNNVCQAPAASLIIDADVKGPSIVVAGVTANGTLNIKDALNTVLNANPNMPVDDAGSFIGMVIGTYRPQYKPLIPPNVGAIAEEAFRERVFLHTIVKAGVNIRQPIDQARTVCQVLDTGVTFRTDVASGGQTQ